MNEEVIKELIVELNRQSRELKVVRENVLKVVNFIHDAESEIPERVRRFMNYMHDVHDIVYMYEQGGQPVPQYVHRELERLHDRYRQILKEMNAQGATFEKIRREMASDPENTYDHTKLLSQWEKDHEARQSK